MSMCHKICNLCSISDSKKRSWVSGDRRHEGVICLWCNRRHVSLWVTQIGVWMWLNMEYEVDLLPYAWKFQHDFYHVDHFILVLFGTCHFLGNDDLHAVGLRSALPRGVWWTPRGTNARSDVFCHGGREKKKHKGDFVWEKLPAVN